MGNSEQRRRERLDRGIKVRSDSLYALMSWRELGYLTVPRLVLIVGMLILPLVMPSMYWQRVITIVCIYALLALSFDFLAHYLGLVPEQNPFLPGPAEARRKQTKRCLSKRMSDGARSRRVGGKRGRNRSG